jgi:hypothetical protein
MTGGRRWGLKRKLLLVFGLGGLKRKLLLVFGLGATWNALIWHSFVGWVEPISLVQKVGSILVYVWLEEYLEVGWVIDMCGAIWQSPSLSSFFRWGHMCHSACARVSCAHAPSAPGRNPHNLLARSRGRSSLSSSHLDLPANPPCHCSLVRPDLLLRGCAHATP